jgi:N4-gp56 family major capsid protein
MAGSVTLYGDIGNNTAFYFKGRMLKVAIPSMCMGRYGQFVSVPKNKTTAIKWRKYNPFAPTLTPLTEGVTPSADEPTVTDVEVVLTQFGRRVVLSDVIMDTHEDPVMQQVSIRLGELAAQMQELVCFNAIRGGTSVQWVGGTTRATVSSAITGAALDRAIRTLKRGNTGFVTGMLQASDKVATQPVRKGFIAFCHVDLQMDLEKIAGYIPVANYASGQAQGDHEIGSYKELRFMTSTLYGPWMAAGASGSTLLTNGVGNGTTGNADVYPIVIVGEDAYAQAALAGTDSIVPVVVNPKPSDSDPLGQRGHVGFKFWSAARILQDSFMTRIECGVAQ